MTFDRFVSKDPFRQQVSARSSRGGAGPPADDGKDDGSSPGANPPVVTPTGGNGGGDGGSGSGSPDDDGHLIATLDVNGNPETVAVGAPVPRVRPDLPPGLADFEDRQGGPRDGPVLDGSATVTIKVGKSVTLVSQPDGLRYRITLVRIS